MAGQKAAETLESAENHRDFSCWGRRQTFGDRINFHPHFHFLATEGGVDEAGEFHKVLRIDDTRLAELFAREVLASLVRKELLSLEWAERLLSWRHTGFNVHSLVRAKTKTEAERVGKYMIR